PRPRRAVVAREQRAVPRGRAHAVALAHGRLAHALVAEAESAGHAGRGDVADVRLPSDPLHSELGEDPTAHLAGGLGHVAATAGRSAHPVADLAARGMPAD